MDWVIVIGAGLAAMAGAIGGSAEKGDRLQDIPAVFRRRPCSYLGAGTAAAIAVLIIQLSRGS